MGSSRVMMWQEELVFNLSMIEARVVDFPDPVGPVTRNNPEETFTISNKIGGKPSASKSGMRLGI